MRRTARRKEMGLRLEAGRSNEEESKEGGVGVWGLGQRQEGRIRRTAMRGGWGGDQRQVGGMRRTPSGGRG
jgi:hypothetical protein